MKKALSPLVGGLLLDLVDLVTYGPAGLYGGFVIGGAVAWWLAAGFGFSRRMQLAAALAGAVYSATPATEFLPLGTLVGALLQWRRDRAGDA